SSGLVSPDEASDPRGWERPRGVRYRTDRTRTGPVRSRSGASPGLHPRRACWFDRRSSERGRNHVNRRRSIAGAGALLGVILAPGLWAAPAALAQVGDTTSDTTQVVFDGRLDVPAGQTVESAVIFNGPATVEGTVQKSLVVFNGSAVISGTVNGDVVVFN